MEILKIPFDRGTRIVQAEEIIRVESLSNYSKIFFSSGNPMTVAKILHWFEDHLPKQMFARVHRSHLVNKLFIQDINQGHHSIILLTSGEGIPVSRRKKVLFNTV